MIKLSDLAEDLKPYVLRWIEDSGKSSTSVSTIYASDPLALYRDGSRALDGNLAVAAGKTIDGVDISVFAANQIIAGSGLIGGGVLGAGNVTLNAGAGVGILVNADDVAVNQAYAFTWSARHTFGAGLTSNNSIDGTYGLIPGRRDWATDGTGYGGAGVYNDGSPTYNRLMIVGSNAGGGLRRIGLWDDVDVARLISSQSFASGFTGNGWRIDQGVSYPSQATAEFDNLTVRGLMRVYELLIHKIRTGNGSYLFAPGGKVQSVSGTGPYTIVFETDHGLAANDLVRAQKFDLGFGGVYQSNLAVTSITNTTTLAANLVSGVPPAVGYEYARLGNSADTNRRGGVYITSDDTNAPYIDVYDGVAAFTDWGNPSLLRARLGRLNGITDPLFGALSGYGLYSQNVYLTGAIRAMSGRIDGVLDIGVNGEIRQGTGTWGVNFTGTRMWQTGNVGQMGGYNNQAAQWYSDTNGWLVGGAGRTIMNASGFYTRGGSFFVQNLGGTLTHGRISGENGAFVGGGLPGLRIVADGGSTTVIELGAAGTGGSNVAGISLQGGAAIPVIAFYANGYRGQLDTDGLFLSGNLLMGGTINAGVINASTIYASSGVITGAPIATHVYRTTSQSIPNATWTTVSFSAAISDPWSRWDGATACYAQYAGYYQVSVRGTWASNATGVRMLAIVRNGSDYVDTQEMTAVNGLDHHMSTSCLVYLSAGEYVQMRVYQNSGGAMNIGGTASAFYCRMGFAKIA